MDPNNLDPELPEAQPQVLSYDVEDAFAYDVAFRIGFVGIGQGGGRLAATFRELGYARCCAINTDHSDLSSLPDSLMKLDFETGGAGKDPQKGAAAIEGKEEQVYDLLTRAVGKKPDYLLVCAGLGGGTGSGLAPKIIEIARKYMSGNDRDPKRVGAIVTLPHTAEGQLPCLNAVHAFQQIFKLDVSPLFVVDNKRINEVFQTGVAAFYSRANNQIARLFHKFNQLAAQDANALVTFDRADLASLLDSGVCVFGASPIPEYKNQADIAEKIREHLTKNVLAPVDYSRGKKAGCIFVGNKEILDTVPMDFFDGGFTMLTRLLSDGSTVHRGIYVGDVQQLACYTMLAQLPPPSLKRLAEAGRISGGGMSEFLDV